LPYEIKALDLLDVDVESSFLVLTHDIGVTTRAKVWSYLLLGEGEPVLVDTGAASPQIMLRLGMPSYRTEEQRVEGQLELHGLAMDDVRTIVHTHTHIDHAGQDDRFPNATVVMNRRELEYSASGLQGAQYPPEYVKHHIDRLHTPGALRLLDLELSGPDEIQPGIVCEAAGAHTEGSMNVLVETAEGTACICGDVVYDIHHSIVEPYHIGLAREPQTSGNHGMSKRHERAAIKKALNSGTFLLPMHDEPARIEHGRVVARLTGRSVPGPETPIEPIDAEALAAHA
jgi:glyoxylase-like metal-dependent hydrolase (beta-lactamase superfamily II)